MASLTDNLLVKALRSPGFDFTDPANEAALSKRVKKLTTAERTDLIASLDEISARVLAVPGAGKSLTERGVAVLLLTDDETVLSNKDFETKLPDFVARKVNALSNAALMDKISEIREMLKAENPALILGGASDDVEAILTGSIRQIGVVRNGRMDIPGDKLNALKQLLKLAGENFGAIKWTEPDSLFNFTSTLIGLNEEISEPQLNAVKEDCLKVLKVFILRETKINDLEAELKKIFPALTANEVKFFTDGIKALKSKRGNEFVPNSLIAQFIQNKLSAMGQEIAKVETQQKTELDNLQSMERVLLGRLETYRKRRIQFSEAAKIPGLEGQKKTAQGKLEQTRKELLILGTISRLLDRILGTDGKTAREVWRAIHAALSAIPSSENSVDVRSLRAYIKYLEDAQIHNQNLASLAGAITNLDLLQNDQAAHAILSEFKNNQGSLAGFDETKKAVFMNANILYLKRIFEARKAKLDQEIQTTDAEVKDFEKQIADLKNPPQPPAPVAPPASAAPQPRPAPSSGPGVTSPNLAPQPSFAYMAQSLAPQPSAPAAVKPAPAAAPKAAAKIEPFKIEKLTNVQSGQIAGLKAVINGFKDCIKEKTSPSGYYQQIDEADKNHGPLAAQVFGAFYQIMKESKKLVGPTHAAGDYKGHSVDAKWGRTVFLLRENALYQDLQGNLHSLPKTDELNKIRLDAMERVLAAYEEKK